MGASSYEDLLWHVGHRIVCVGYAPDDDGPRNVAVECESCGVVLLDFDRDGDKFDGGATEVEVSLEMYIPISGKRRR